MSFKKSCLLPGLLLIACLLVRAKPGGYLVSTDENECDQTIDFKYWSVEISGDPVIRSPEIGFGDGVTKRWYTEPYRSDLKPKTQGAKSVDVTWQNDCLLTEGPNPCDMAPRT